MRESKKERGRLQKEEGKKGEGQGLKKREEKKVDQVGSGWKKKSETWSNYYIMVQMRDEWKSHALVVLRFQWSKW